VAKCANRTHHRDAIAYGRVLQGWDSIASRPFPPECPHRIAEQAREQRLPHLELAMLVSVPKTDDGNGADPCEQQRELTQ
jgi:hypothetical protein